MVSESPTPQDTSPLRVLVVDDHPMFRQGIARALEGNAGYVVVGEASDGLEALEKAGQLRPQVVLMDINMPRCGGLEAILRLRAQMPEVRVLMLTISDKEEDLFSAIKFGARGYLLKDSEPRDILDAVSRVAEGEAVFSPAMAARLLDEFKRRESPAPPQQEPPPLSPRETEVLGLLAGGASNREIGASLFISENTVRTHLKNILEKLHLKNRTQAAAYAARLGMTG